MEINCSHQKIVPIDQLTEHPANANKHSQRQVEMLAKIMKYQGWRHPIVVSKLSGFIVAGHGRLAAAKLNGWDKAPVDMQDFEDKTAEIAFLYADNKIAAMAEHDDELMKAGLLELDLDDDFDFELLGLPDFEMNPTLSEIKNTGTEMDLSSFDNFQHQCPKCGFEWNDNGTT